MNADITKATFDKTKHYRKVNKQQGRVNTDADDNESVDIQVHHETSLLRDLVGKAGSSSDIGGFEIKVNPSGTGFGITKGNYYVDGILCENEKDTDPADQPDLKPLYFVWDAIHSDEREGARFKKFLKKAFNLQWIDDEGIQTQQQGTDNGSKKITIAGNTKVSKDNISRSISISLQPMGVVSDEGVQTKGPAIAVLRDDAENKGICHFVVRETAGKQLIGYTPALPTREGYYLAYLDVWERHLTWLDDPSIREVALGGADTTTRSKTIWQVKVVPVDATNIGDYACQSEFRSWDHIVKSKPGTLQARRVENPKLQNQLYRIEIHNEGEMGKGATFKWSRENGSIVTRISEIATSGNMIRVDGVGRDGRLGFAPGQWIEVIDDRRQLWGLPGTIVKIDGIKDNVIALDSTTIKDDDDEITNENFPLESNPKIKRWDSVGIVEVIIPLDNDGYLEVEDGIQVKFSEGAYKTGDYWLIPARASTADIEWPKLEGRNDPIRLPPKGICHNFSRLGLLKYENGKLTLVDDCRLMFNSASSLFLHYVGGDGQEDYRNEELPTMLQVAVMSGSKPVKGIKVQFQVTTDGGNGSLFSEESPDPKRSIILRSKEGGIARCTWRLGDKPVPQQVRASLLDAKDSPIHIPLYFNANVVDPPGIAANTGLIDFDTSLTGGVQYVGNEVKFGPYKHDLQVISSPPAIVLGVAHADLPTPDSPTSDDNPEDRYVEFMEDYKLHGLPAYEPWNTLEFKAVDININHFRISISRRTFDALRNAGNPTVSLRWWAIPAMHRGTQTGEHGAPEMTFDPGSVSYNQPTKIVIRDSRANTDPNMIDTVSVTLLSGEPQQQPDELQARETHPKSAEFVTEEIQIVGEGRVKIGDIEHNFPGARPGGSIRASYSSASGSDIYATLSIVLLPVLTIDPNPVSYNQPTKIVIRDSRANTDPNMIDTVSVTLANGWIGPDPNPFIEIQARETHPNSAEFVTEEIRALSPNYLKIGDIEHEILFNTDDSLYVRYSRYGFAEATLYFVSQGNDEAPS